MSTAEAGPDILIGAIRKNSHQKLHIVLRPRKGCQLIDYRLFVPSLTGELRPTRDGAAMPLTALPEIIKALQDAEAEARRLGLLPRIEEAPA